MEVRVKNTFVEFAEVAYETPLRRSMSVPCTCDLRTPRHLDHSRDDPRPALNLGAQRPLVDANPIEPASLMLAAPTSSTSAMQGAKRAGELMQIVAELPQSGEVAVADAHHLPDLLTTVEAAASAAAKAAAAAADAAKVSEILLRGRVLSTLPASAPQFDWPGSSSGNWVLAAHPPSWTGPHWAAHTSLGEPGGGIGLPPPANCPMLPCPGIVGTHPPLAQHLDYAYAAAPPPWWPGVDGGPPFDCAELARVPAFPDLAEPAPEEEPSPTAGPGAQEPPAGPDPLPPMLAKLDRLLGEGADARQPAKIQPAAVPARSRDRAHPAISREGPPAQLGTPTRACAPASAPATTPAAADGAGSEPAAPDTPRQCRSKRRWTRGKDLQGTNATPPKHDNPRDARRRGRKAESWPAQIGTAEGHQEDEDAPASSTISVSSSQVAKVLRCSACGTTATCGMEEPTFSGGRGSPLAKRDDAALPPPPGLEKAKKSVSDARRYARKQNPKANCPTCGAIIRCTLAPRRWCCFYLRIPVGTFDLVPIIIGWKGCNTRRIAEATQAKVRVRGKGSGHLESTTGKEAPTPLMMVVATEANNDDGFFQAVKMTIELLRYVEERYFAYCQWARIPPRTPTFTIGNMPDGIWAELKMELGDALPPRHGE